MIHLFKKAICVLFALSLLSCGGDNSELSVSGDVPEPAEPTPRKSFLLIIIDTLRADHLSCYGYDRYTSPSIDSLAAEGTLWAFAQAQSPWTLPSHASIWTGLSVRSHMTTTNEDWFADRTGEKNFALDESLPALPQLLNEAGYSTFGLANVCLLGETYGFNRGFDIYSCHNAGHGRAGVSVDSLIEWLGEHGEEDFFCMLHLYDVHAPYDPPGHYSRLYTSGSSSSTNGWIIQENSIQNPQDRDHLVNLYDGEISWVDDNLSRLFRWIRENDLDDRTVIVVTSDHGEEFLEHGWVDHGHSLYQEVVHVPLIMCGPGIDSGAVDSTVAGQFDLLPTLLSLAEIESSCSFDGDDILSTGLQDERWVPASGVTPLPWRADNHLASVVSGSLKTVAVNDLDSLVSYNIVNDPAEIRPMPPDSQGVEEVLYYWASPQIGFPEPAMPSQEVTETLRDLGYID